MLDVELKTGRTHQIRVHLMSIGHPVVGDRFYNRNERDDYLHLFARYISFHHPRDGREMSFEIDMPDRFKSTLEGLKEI